MRLVRTREIVGIKANSHKRHSTKCSELSFDNWIMREKFTAAPLFLEVL